ncbi:A disintegrin and metalloproteinase with thrombospondin motifs 1-like isoform X1 [Apostichopus japonicus]|uniref:A disintegrin and metalloproteinase with thrombospondin motifs 1-like isoform X1 n=1 Tax=Stichopus japonicus TaxID=307972 RepID=UPI003AB34ED1
MYSLQLSYSCYYPISHLRLYSTNSFHSIVQGPSPFNPTSRILTFRTQIISSIHAHKTLRVYSVCSIGIPIYNEGVCFFDIFTLTENDWKAYVKSSDEVKDYDIFVPGVLNNERAKRSLNSSFAKTIKFTAFGEYFHLDLFQSETFFDPNLEVKFIREDNTIETRPLEVSPDCFYHGYVPTHNYSRATVSLCSEAMYGYINHGDNGIFIAPLTKEHGNEYSRRKRSTGQAHLIYKRALGNGEFCPVKPSLPLDGAKASSGFAEQIAGEFAPPKYLEILLILDRDYVSNRSPDYQTYALALMHVVSRRFAEPSLDVSFQLFILDMVVLTSDNPTIYSNSLTVTSDGSTTLDSLIDWNVDSNTPNGQPGHWDNVILVSGKDLTSASAGSGLLGIASILGTCVTGQGSSVNEDNGISSGLTIAHEVGHTMTITHDQDLGCNTPSGFIMSASLSASANAYRWSTCSRSELKRFFRSSASSCLDNIPDGATALPTLVLPGAMYDLDAQCQQAVGTQSCLVDNQVNCQRLLCSVGGSCEGSFRPTAEGTPCGVDMICLDGICISSADIPEPVDGVWGEWVDGTCSRTCDCGVQIRQRLCDNPKPQWGGAHCEGEGQEITLCNRDVSCGNVPDDHRNEQCAESDDVPRNGVTHSWSALFGSNILERFYCQNPCQAGSLGELRPPFQNVDGTDCWDHDLSEWSKLFKCVEAACVEFGCDGVPGSGICYDVCRICNGDGSTCTQVSGTVNSGTLSEFNNVHTIPMGAVSLIVRNSDLQSGNHIAISSGLGDFFRGSGSSPSTIDRSWFQTMTIIHESDDIQETFFSQGPSILDLTIELYLTSAISGSITYEYYIPNVGISYIWNVRDFGSCSVTCGVGGQTRLITCDEVNGVTQTVVADSLCITNVGLKPLDTQSCTLEDCYAWVTGEYGACDADCGSGVRSRTVDCKEGDTPVDESMCTETKPDTEMPCDQGTCEWDIRDFGECTVTCGGGTMTGTVVCANSGGSGDVVDDEDCSGEKPDATLACNTDDCGEECCQYVHDRSGTIERTLGTEGQTCVIFLIARLGMTFDINIISQDISSGLEMLTFVDRFRTQQPSLDGGIIEVKYRLAGGSFKFDFTRITASYNPSGCDAFIDTTPPNRPSRGNIRSPRYRRKYPSNSNCRKRILAKKDEKIVLTFRDFKLQARRNRCRYDSLRVTNLVTGSSSIYCGRIRRLTLNMDYDTLLHFKSNAKRNFRGFSIDYFVNSV